MGVSHEEVLRKTRHLLSRLSFMWQQDQQVMSAELDSILAALVDAPEELPRVRGALRDGMAERARRGGAEVNAADFFRDHQLESLPLYDWASYRERAQDILVSDLQAIGYDPEQDVRAHAARDMVARWANTVRDRSHIGRRQCDN
jgi:hypothetical protein